MPTSSKDLDDAAPDSGTTSLKALLKPCSSPLRDFGPSPDSTGLAYGDVSATCISIEAQRLPLKPIVRLVMAFLVGAPNLGRSEKLDWEYEFLYQNRRCAIASRKFGLRLYLAVDGVGAARVEPTRTDLETAADIVRRLSLACRCIERLLLRPMAKSAFSKGEVTIHNQVGILRGMYEYHRTRADTLYADASRVPDPRQPQETVEQVKAYYEELFRPIHIERTAFFETIAMTAAYFSYLEHMLVLCLPATSFNPKSDAVTGFIGLRLLDKLDRIAAMTGDLDLPSLRRRLHDAAERWRNPYSHGGFDKARGTLSFRVDGLGHLPIQLSDIRNHPSFHFTPSREIGFEELCKLFDNVDGWLQAGSLEAGWRWARAGLSVGFDDDFLQDFRFAQHGFRGSFDDFVDYASEALDRQENMDW